MYEHRARVFPSSVLFPTQWDSAFILAALPFLVVGLQHLQNLFLHLVGSVAFGEVFPDLAHLDPDTLLLVGLFLAHDFQNLLRVQPVALRELFQPDSLGQGRRTVLGLHDIPKLRLLQFGQVGQLHAGRESNAAFVNQF